jgi:hypothetical protein
MKANFRLLSCHGKYPARSRQNRKTAAGRFRLANFAPYIDIRTREALMLYLETLKGLAILAGLGMVIVGQSSQGNRLWVVGGIGLMGLVVIAAAVSAVLRVKESKAQAMREGRQPASEQ